LATTEAVAALVASKYDVPAVVSSELLFRGFNDSYLIRTETSKRFVLRVSGRRSRGPADVAAETKFLRHLHAAGVPVAAPLAIRTGDLFTGVMLPEGMRPAVLFHYVDGRRPEVDDPLDAQAQGITLARVHDCADSYPGRSSGSYRLDLNFLLHRQAAAISALKLETSHAQRELAGLAARLDEAVRRLDRSLTRTRCHGDCHGMNARVATEGEHAGQAVFFDFDDGGYGYLSYDLAVHLWAQVSFGRRTHSVWRAFRMGYGSVRSVAPADEEALPIFVAIRHIWLLGEYAARTAEFGTEVMSTKLLSREVDFLLQWERDQISSGLFEYT
jgi:Ser/Thr protein kinase RdoA (MazF antagonist)